MDARISDLHPGHWAGPHARDRFLVTADGIRLLVRQWAAPGATTTPLVLCDGLGCDGYIWKYVVGRYAGERPLLHLTYRGHGRSDVPRDLTSVTLARIVDDVIFALDDCDIQDCVLVGHSMGVQVALETYRALRKARRVRGIASLCGPFERPIATWHGAAFSPHEESPLGNRVMQRVFDGASRFAIDNWHRIAPVWPRIALSRFALDAAIDGELTRELIKEEDFAPYMQTLAAMDMRVFATLARDLAQHSARDLLPHVDVPTLVVGGGRDKFCPLWIAEEMHRLLGACGGHKELVRLVLGSHGAPLEEPRIFERALDRLLAVVDA